MVTAGIELWLLSSWCENSIAWPPSSPKGQLNIPLYWLHQAVSHLLHVMYPADKVWQCSSSILKVITQSGQGVLNRTGYSTEQLDCSAVTSVEFSHQKVCGHDSNPAEIKLHFSIYMILFTRQRSSFINKQKSHLRCPRQYLETIVWKSGRCDWTFMFWENKQIKI